MARTKTIQELQAERERIENELKIKTQKLKELKAQQQEQQRKERTHRLCTHGAMLEQYLSPEEFSDDQIDKILKALFQSEQTKQFVNRLKGQPDQQPATQ